MSDQPVLPDRAEVVVIGGGVIGCSVAYHLAAEGVTDVVVLERDRLTSGTTWHAAGLMVTFGSTSETSTRMRQYTRDLYARLEVETGQATGFKPVGFIELAADVDRLEEYRRVAAFNRWCGVDVHEIGPREIGELFPLARTDDLLAGFYVPGDGRANPVDVTMALARGARQRGVRIVEGVAATGLVVERGAVRGVRTALGTIEAATVVNCAGMWARQLAEDAGVTVPLQAAEHYYLITETMPGLDAATPVIEDPASFGYYREEVGGLMIGLFEPVCAPWKLDGVPGDFSFGQLAPDWDRMAPYVERAMGRVPASFDIGIRTFFCGPESFTPDLAPIVGEAPELRNYFVAAGLNSIGILTGGGIGRAVAHWIVAGRPDVDITAIDVARLQPYQANRDYRRTRTVESLGMVYQCHYPNRAMQTARGACRSPLHDRFAARGAWFREVSGWEGADWFEPSGPPRPPALSWGRQPWHDNWRDEHLAVRTAVGLIDMSFMAKFVVQGRDAGAFLERLSANHVDGGIGTITYTPWLNEAGTIEADLTVTKLAADRFLVVATDTAHRHVPWWMARNIGADEFVTITDVTSGLAQINVQGPRSRALLAEVTSVDLSNESFPFRHARPIDVGFARPLCVRITYVGELGYELYVPTEQAVHVHDRLVEAGAAHGLRHAGLKALGSLRMEKGYRDYGHDIDNTDDPDSVGLAFAVASSKPGGFLGDAALAERRAAGPPRARLVQVRACDPEPLLYHAEVVCRDGEPVGYVRSASYGWTLGGAVGLAMVGPRGDADGGRSGGAATNAWLESGRWEVDVAGTLVPIEVSRRPLYDPAGDRVRA